MKKKLLLLFAILIIGLGIKAQCPTCHDGAHWPLIYDSTQNLAHPLPPNVTPNGNDILGTAPTYIAQNVCGLNYITESMLTTTREASNPGTGFPSTLTLPNCLGAPVKAYLYWGVSYWEATPPNYTVSITNPVPSTSTYAATNIGTGPAKCWGEVGTAAYRADVTASIGPGGAYSITVNGPSTSSDDKEIDGCTLVYVYNSGGAYSGSIALWDGNYIESGFGSLSETLSGINVCATTATASGFTACGDEQANVAATHTDIINGSTATFNNNFWNTDIIPLTVTTGQTTCAYTPYSNNPGDCYSWILAGLYWQNTTCVVCTPTALTVTIPTFVNPTCGNNNGSATATVTGGTPPYTYLWTPSNQTTATATGLSAGTYTVRVEDASGCTTVTATVTLTTTQLTVNANTTANEPCNGNTVGSANATVTGGTAPFTYAWTPTGGTNANATGLSAGTYTITVHDNSGCTGTAIVTITQPPLLTATISTSTGVLCNGGTTGTATVTAGGGTPAYTYAWAPIGGTNAIGTGMSAGTYTVTVKDNNGCTQTTTVNITQPPVLTANSTLISPASCGNSNGSASVTAGGGTPAYTYSWAPNGGTNATGTGLSAGTYTVSVKDNNGCSQTATVIVTQLSGVTVNITASTNILCNGAATGSATVTASGGTPAYTYAWTPTGGTNATATGLTAGSYTVNVTDANGCSNTAAVTITQPPLLSVTISSSTNIICNGGNNGSAIITAAGGTPAYTYLWTPVGGTNTNATGLSVGTYIIKVTDANGCTATNTVTITQPPLLTATISATTNVLCNGGSTGTAMVTAGGGTPAYTYSWAPTGGTNATGTGLSAGTYTVTVTDANGCASTTTVIITQPTVVTANITVSVNILCNGGNNGSATVTAGGGTLNYTYTWTPAGGTNAIGTGMTAGSYTVTVTDANGCTATTGVTITQPTVVTANITASVNVLCDGGNNGSATVAAGGGTPNYTYAWTPTGGTNTSATGLTAGTYTITVTDANGCTATNTVTITEPPVLTATTSFTQASCNLSNGSATVTVGGGTPNYTYIWTPGGNTNSTATGLSANSYTVVVTDANGCTETTMVIVTQPSAVAASITGSTGVSCNGGNDGMATATAAGGTAPYTYSWAPIGGTNATGTGMSAGTYTVTVTDNNGCIITATVIITEPTAVTANITASVNVLCNTGNNGSAIVLAGGGTPNYTYAWTPAGGTNATGTGMTAGTYTVTVTDANGCIQTTGVTITEPPLLTATIPASTNVLCNGGATGSATVAAGGGTPNYTYAWTPAGGTNTSAAGLTAGTYTITVTDANGCTATNTVNVTEPPALTANITASVNISCFGGTNGTATVTAGGGTIPYTYLWSPSSGTNSTGTGMAAGNYTVTVTDNNGCTATASVGITQPTILAVGITGQTGASCFGGNNGTATSVASGGTLPYAYSWTPAGGTNAIGTGLSAGNFTITVTDANGCTATNTVIITQPNLLTVTTTIAANVSCNGGNNGSATATVTGGTNPYLYAWTPSGGTNANGTGMTAGIYTVTVTDANGCSATATATITQPTALTASIGTVNDVKCNGGIDGNATAAGAGGTLPYKYLWAPGGGTNALVSGLIAGSYSVTVTDANGCTASASVTITQPTILTTSLTSINVSCSGGNNGSATSTTNGGTTPYAYSWSNAQITANASNLTAGSYMLTVTDANGCTATASVIITEPAKLIVNASGPQSVCSGAPATLISNASGGTALYTYSWSPAGGTTATTTTNPVSSTIYTVTVTDANGCVVKATVSVLVDAPLILNVSGKNSGCPGSTINLIATGSGGDGAYSYVWLPSNITSQSVSFNPTKDSTVTVELTDGCGSSMASINIPIMVDPLPKVSFSSDIYTGCIPLCIQFRNMTTISSGGIYAYGWKFGNGDSSSVIDPLYCYKDTGVYSVTLTATTDSGCSSTLNVLNLITVYPPPAANFSYSPNPINILNPQVQFTDQSSGKYPINEWYWTFGQGDSSSFLQNPGHTYTDTGIFCAHLMIVDIHGCIDSITNCLVVNPLFTFYIPDAFSPNGDGLNDVFLPKGTYVKTYEMYIYDRWGEQLFHSTDINNGWDGIVRGGNTISQEDTYVYLINITDSQNEQHSYTGKINLIK